MKKSNSIIALAVIVCMIVVAVPFLGHKVYADGEYTITFEVAEGEHTISSEGRNGEIIIDGSYVNFKDATNNELSIGEVNVAADGKSATITVTSGVAGCINFGGSNAFSLFIGNSENPFNNFGTTFSSNTTTKINVIPKEELKVVIANKNYDLLLNNSTASSEFKKLLPQTYAMSELNGNEKYVYLNTSLTSNPVNVGKINAGDLMLYQNNCIVLFYKTFNTTYSYTPLGHVNNLGNLGSSDVIVKFVKS